MPQEIGAFVLNQLKMNGDAHAHPDGQECKDVVITVPAYFNNTQRSATRQAAEISQLNVVGIISEPTAAATYYASKQKVRGKLLIFDLGGGTFDITIANIDENEHVQIKSVTGDTHLGGSDFDHAFMTYVLDKIKEEFTAEGQDFNELSEKQKKKLEFAVMGEVIKAKEVLSDSLSTEINIEVP